MVSFTDLENHKTKFIYDSDHRLIQVINANNEVITTNVYDEMGRIIYIYDVANRRSEYKQQTVVQEVITVTDRRNNLQFIPFTDGNLESIKDLLLDTPPLIHIRTMVLPIQLQAQREALSTTMR